MAATIFTREGCVINENDPLGHLQYKERGKPLQRGRKNDEQQNGDELQTRKRGEKADDSQGTVSFRLV